MSERDKTMKVLISVGKKKFEMSYGSTDRVGEILEMAVNNVRHSPRGTGKTEGHFRTQDGAILDNDDLMSDVIDNNDMIRVVFGNTDDGDNYGDDRDGYGDSSGDKENETSTWISLENPLNSSQKFQKVRPRLSHLLTPPLPPNQSLPLKFSTGPRQKSKSAKMPTELLNSGEQIFTFNTSPTPTTTTTNHNDTSAFSRYGARKSLGNTLTQDPWYEARYKLHRDKQKLETLEDTNNSSQCLLDNWLQNSNKASDGMPTRIIKSELANNLSPTNHSGSLLSIDQSAFAMSQPSPPITKGTGLRPKSAVVGFLTEFRGDEVTTTKIDLTEKTDFGVSDKQQGDDEASPEHPILPSSASSSSSSLKKKKNQSGVVLAPSNTRVIGKMMNIILVKGSSGLGFTITSRDNMSEMNSPIYIKNILPDGAAQSDGRLRVLDRLLAVNGVDVSNAKQSEVTQLLRRIPIGQEVELLISRQVSDDDDGKDAVELSEENNNPEDPDLTTKRSKDHHQHPPQDVINQPFDINSSRQPSLTKEMEKFLSSSLSPPHHTPEEVWTAQLSELLPSSNCHLKPLILNQKLVGLLIQASPCLPEYQLLEIDGKPLNHDVSPEECVDLVKAAINKAWSKDGSKVVVKVKRPVRFFESHGFMKTPKLTPDHVSSAQIPNPGHRKHRMPPLPHGPRDHALRTHVKGLEVRQPPSKSAPTTPVASKLDRFLTGPEEVEVVDDHVVEEEGQQGVTFDRKGFGRQSMSEKRKGHVDPRSFDFYRQISSQKMKMMNETNDDVGTSYATWDSRKAAKMRKAANASLRNKLKAVTTTNGDKQYKSMEELSANQERPAVLAKQLPSSVGLSYFGNDTGKTIATEENPGDKETTKVDNHQDNVDLHGRTDGRSGRKITRLSRDTKSKNAIAMEHMKFISYMKKTVENLRLSPKIDSPFNSPLTSPALVTTTTTTTKHPSEPKTTTTNHSPKTPPSPIDSVTLKDDSASSSTGDEIPETSEKNKATNVSSSLKFAIRSLPKRFSKSPWPFQVSKVKGHEASPVDEPQPPGRLQPEGKEEGLPMSSQVDTRHFRSLAHVPILRVGEMSNIYKDMAQQQQQQQEPNLQSPPWLGYSSQSQMGDWHSSLGSQNKHQSHHFRQQSHELLDRHDDSNQQHRDIYQQQYHHTPFSQYGQQQQHHQNVFPFSRHPIQQYRHNSENISDTNSRRYDAPFVAHRTQRSYDGSLETPPAGRALTTLSLKMKPIDVWNSRDDSKQLDHQDHGIRGYSPEMQYKTYVCSNKSPKYVTTLKVSCDNDVGNSVHSNDENAFGFHLLQQKPQQNFPQEVTWIRSARV